MLGEFNRCKEGICILFSIENMFYLYYHIGKERYID